MIPDLAEAILDRLLERGPHFVLRGRSCRTRNHEEDLPTTPTSVIRSWLQVVCHPG